MLRRFSLLAIFSVWAVCLNAGDTITCYFQKPVDAGVGEGIVAVNLGNPISYNNFKVAVFDNLGLNPSNFAMVYQGQHIYSQDRSAMMDLSQLPFCGSAPQGAAELRVQQRVNFSKNGTSEVTSIPVYDRMDIAILKKYLQEQLGFDEALDLEVAGLAGILRGESRELLDQELGNLIFADGDIVVNAARAASSEVIITPRSWDGTLATDLKIRVGEKVSEIRKQIEDDFSMMSGQVWKPRLFVNDKPFDLEGSRELTPADVQLLQTASSLLVYQ